MRRLIMGLAALLIGACSQAPQSASTASAGCARSATRDVAWSNANASDVVTARSEGPTCAQAVVTFVMRNAQGDPLWAFAATHHDMTAGGPYPLDGAPDVTEAQMDQFLTNWANVTQMRSTELPEWREGAATLTESATTFSYDTPFDREVYETMRSRDLPMVCFAVGAETSRCLIIDPADHAPGVMVTYGP